MKNVMTKAWEIARQGQKNFGGQVKEYFAQALRMAWAIIKKGGNKMNGSEKQVKWARDIKERMFKHLENVKINWAGKEKDQAAKKRIVRMMELVGEELDQIEDAKTFINNKKVMDITNPDQAFAVISEMIDAKKIHAQVMAEFK